MHEQLIFLVLNDLLGHSLAIAKALSTLTCSLRVAQSATSPPHHLSLHREQRRGPQRPRAAALPFRQPLPLLGAAHPPSSCLRAQHLQDAFRFAAVFTGAECALLPPLDRGLLGARYYFVPGRFSRALSGSFVFSHQVALEPGAARAAEDARSAAAGGTEGP